MFLLPLLATALLVFAAYRVMHRSAPLAAAEGGPPVRAAVDHGPGFWPTTIEGRLGVTAFVVGIALTTLVNVVQVPFLGWAVQLVALVATVAARFRRHDRSTAVLVVLVLTGIGLVFSVLFLAGEVFIGHD